MGGDVRHHRRDFPTAGTDFNCALPSRRMGPRGQTTWKGMERPALRHGSLPATHRRAATGPAALRRAKGVVGGRTWPPPFRPAVSPGLPYKPSKPAWCHIRFPDTRRIAHMVWARPGRRYPYPSRNEAAPPPSKGARPLVPGGWRRYAAVAFSVTTRTTFPATWRISRSPRKP